MHLLITRPEDDARSLQTKLNALGIESSIAPALEISFEDLGADTFDSLQAIAITSQNALKSLIHNQLVESLQTHAVYTVGPATAELAKSLGFTSVTTGPGTARALAALLISECKPDKGAILHLAGAHLAFDLKAALEAEQFTVRDVVTYSAAPARTLPDAVITALSGKRVNGVILMSARSATSFADQIKRHNLAENATELCYFCLSPAVRDSLLAALPAVQAQSVRVPDRPNTEELLALITRFAANYGQTS